MKNLPIRAQLAIGFGSMILLTLIGSVLIWYETTQSERRSQIARQSTLGAVALADAQSALWQLRYGFPQFMLVDEAGRKKIVDEEPGHYAVIARSLAAYEAASPSELERKALNDLKEVYGQYIAARPKWFALYGAGKQEEAQAWRAATTTPLGAATVKGFTDVIALQQKVSAENYQAAVQELQDMRRFMLLVSAFAVLAGVVFAWSITRFVTRPIQEAVAATKRVADGDLTVEVRPEGRSETADLLRGVQRMIENLRTLVTQVAEGARTVSETSEMIAQGNHDLAQRTEIQAGTLEETAGSMEEMTSTIGQNAGNAKLASELAVSASDVARRGGDVVGQVVTTMAGISRSSKKIADIVAVIDGIAFQTNILALNAAVEAARVGEQGRGFAVVASEVRSLAQRSAEAAREIKVLIEDSVAQVDAGTEQVDSAGQTMGEIVQSVKRVSDLIVEIAQASQEQSGGLNHINTAVSQMEQVVQQNAGLVEEASAATESMKRQARSLLETVSRFHLQASLERPPVVAPAAVHVARVQAKAPARRARVIESLPVA